MNFREQIQKEATETLLKFDCGTANVAMRLGKTLIGLKIASNFKKVLVSYPIETIKKGWISDAQEFGFDISHVIFTTHLSLSKHDLSQFDCIILDEFSSSKTNLTDWKLLRVLHTQYSSNDYIIVKEVRIGQSAAKYPSLG